MTRAAAVMVNFVVRGPFDVPVREVGQGARFIDSHKLQELKSASNGAAAKPGCYVFCWRASRGAIPLYVGKASKSALKEAFNPRNLNNLAEYINTKRKGKLQIFFVVQDRVRLFANKRAISNVEEFLIGYAARRNTDLINIHGTGPSKWRIVGVANHGPGGPCASVRDFKQVLGLKTATRVVPESPLEVDSIDPSNSEGEPSETDATADEDEDAQGARVEAR